MGQIDPIQDSKPIGLSDYTRNSMPTSYQEDNCKAMTNGVVATSNDDKNKYHSTRKA